jgi:hypothetical protein
MTATAAQIQQLRRMINEPTAATYSDDELQATIERYPALDERGEQPYDWFVNTTPPTKRVNPDWLATYDLNAAAADLWSEKAAVLSQDYDFQADGGSYTRSQAYEQAMKQSRYFGARRKPTTVTLYPAPRPPVEVDP